MESLAQPEEERVRFVEADSTSSAEIKAEVLRLLAARESGLDLLEDGALAEILRGGGTLPTELPKIGEIIGDRYEIEELIGEGSGSHVYLASDQRLGGNQVAVKLIHGGLEEFQSQREAVWREIEALARVRHAGVSGLIDEGVWRSIHPYVVMQYWRGRTLREVLREGPVSQGHCGDSCCGRWAKSCRPRMRRACCIWISSRRTS